jgi:hypothetical protein
MNGARSPVSARLGGGAAHVYRPRRSPPITEPERMSKPRGRLRVYGLWALVRSNRRATVLAAHHRQAHPVLVQ